MEVPVEKMISQSRKLLYYFFYEKFRKRQICIFNYAYSKAHINVTQLKNLSIVKWFIWLSFDVSDF